MAADPINEQKNEAFQAAISKFDDACESLTSEVTTALLANTPPEPEVITPSSDESPESKATALFTDLSLLGVDERVAIKSGIVRCSNEVKTLVVALQKTGSLEQATEIIELTTKIMRGPAEQNDYPATMQRLNTIAEELIKSPNTENRTLGRALGSFLLVVGGALLIAVGVFVAAVSSSASAAIITFGKACFFDGLDYLRNKESSANEQKASLGQAIIQLKNKATMADEKKIAFRSSLAATLFPPPSLSVATTNEGKIPSPIAASSPASSSTESKTLSPIAASSPVSSATESKTFSSLLETTDEDVEIPFSPDFLITCCAFLEDDAGIFSNIMRLKNGIAYDQEKINSTLRNLEILSDDLFHVRLSGLEGPCDTLGTGYKPMQKFSSLVGDEMRSKMVNGQKLNHYIEVIQRKIPDTTVDEARAILAARSVIGEVRSPGGALNSGALLLAEYLKPFHFLAPLLSEARVERQDDGSFIIESIVRPTDGLLTLSVEKCQRISNPIKYHETYHLKQNEEKEWVLTLQPKNYLYVNKELWKRMLDVANETLNKKPVSSRDLFTIIPYLNNETFATRFQAALEMRPNTMPERADIKLLISACYGEPWPAHLGNLKSVLDAVEETPVHRARSKSPGRASS